MNSTRGMLLLGVSAGSVVLTVSARAASVTSMAGLLTLLQGEAQLWLIGGAIVALIIGLLAHGMSRMNTEFVSIFGHVIEWTGRAAFGAVAVALVALAAPAAGTPLQAVPPEMVGDFVLQVMIELTMTAMMITVLVGGVRATRQRFHNFRA